MTVMPMFPLGSVLFPSMVLPLHVFEPRYRELVRHCLEDAPEPEFGVVLIERGSEVGGGDLRTMVGTVARVVEAATFDDGRWALGCVGTRRIRVRSWLDDEPYPRAEVEDWGEPDAADGLDERVATTLRDLRRALALHGELGDGTVPATIELSDDPVLASYQLAAIGPFGPADRQRLLESVDASARVDDVAGLVADDLQYLEMRLALDADDDDPDR